MKAGWQVKKLGEVCEVVNGGTPKTGVKEYWGNEHLWITPAEMGKRLSPYANDTARKITSQGLRDSSARLLPPDSVILSSRAPIGHLVINTKLMATNQGCKGLVPSESLAYKYLFYFLQANVDLLNDLGSGATFKELSGSKLKEVTIPFPVRPEQQRIVAILDQAFERIAKARANTEQNLQNARALFESHLQSVFSVRPELVEGRGEGWIEKTLGNCCILRSGTTLDPKLEMDSGEIAYLKVADMNLSENINGIFCSSRYVNENAVNISNLLPIGTTIFPKRGGSILTNKKRLTKRVIYADLNIMGVTPKAELLPEFLFSYFLSVDMRKLNNGSSIPQINNYTIEPLLISFPVSLIEQRIVVEKIESLSQEAQRLEALYQRKITLLDELKKSLLQQAFAGEL